MKLAVATVGLLLVAAIAIASAAIRPATAPPGDTGVVEILSGIDYIPSRGSLDDELGAGAADKLIAIARGTAEESADAGVRIRAYRALALYPGATTEAALRASIAEHAGGGAIDTLYLRAAAESLVQIAGADAVDDLVPLLDHQSRDVRASTARALGDTGSGAAVSPLRARLSIEEVGQVRLAIAEALRELE
jgi:urea transport system permease protein